MILTIKPAQGAVIPIQNSDPPQLPSDAIATDTIAAISTPPGRGGIGIVRLSGPDAASIAAQLVHLRQPMEHARARLADVFEGSENDEANPARRALTRPW